MLLHMVIHWPEQANTNLCPFALEHAAYIWNHLPQKDSKLAPLELFTQSRFDNYAALQRLHVFGCPTYILDAALQDHKSIPKWNPRSRRGVYLGYSPQHSSTVTRVLNSQTGHVSPQYHFVCDDHFSTVPNADTGGLLDTSPFDATTWNRLIESGYESYVSEVFEHDPITRQPIVPPLAAEWLSPSEQALRQERITCIRSTARNQPARPQTAPLQGGSHGNVIPRLPLNLQDFRIPIGDTLNDIANRGSGEVADDSSDLLAPEREDDNTSAEGTTELDEDQTLNRTLRHLQEQNPSQSGRRRFVPRRLDEPTALKALTEKVKHTTINHAFLASLQFSNLVETLKSDQFSQMWALTTDYDYGQSTCEWLHPMILEAKENSEDNPTWAEAMNGPLKDGYWNAATKEIKTLEEMEVWEVVPRLQEMNVLPSTWAFKCKRYPDGCVRKLKGRFCVRGDRQKDGVDFDSAEIFAPVVSWQTVQLMLILSIVLGLKTKQVDYTAAFTHAPIGNKEVFCEMPRGFSEAGKVLKLKKSLYGLRQSPINFFNFIKGKLEHAGFESQSDVDPCLFISDKAICLVYVDDTLFFSPKEEYIDEAIASLVSQGVAVEIEESVAGFLGVHIERDESNQTIKLTQKGLTKRIVDALNIDSLSPKNTPALKASLVKDADGEPPNATYYYPSVIGMLLYLCGYSRPDIQFAVSQCARFIHGTTRTHEKALEHIGQYLKSTMDEGLIL